MNLNNTEGRLLDCVAVRTYMLASRAIFTLRSNITQNRYTYKVQRSENRNLYFVGLLCGPENNTDYVYLGVLRIAEEGKMQFNLTRRSKMKMDSLPVAAFNFLIRCLEQKTLPEKLEVWHSGRCGRCGRKLTVPESVASGLGPECAALVAA